MANYREIVTKAIISKGRKVFTHNNRIVTKNKPSTVLGCWVINHNFSGIKQQDKVIINGSYDINIWYSYDNDTKTDVIKETHNYNETVKMNNENHEYDNANIIVRSLNDPKCVKVDIIDENIKYQVDVELGIELVGDVKVKIAVDNELDEYSLIEETEEIDKEIEEKINENYLEENKE